MLKYGSTYTIYILYIDDINFASQSRLYFVIYISLIYQIL